MPADGATDECCLLCMVTRLDEENRVKEISYPKSAKRLIDSRD